MSQQSNPATLREALQTLLDWKPVDGSADALTWRTKLRPLVAAALAASGTEAVPVTCESCKSTNTQRYENAGGLKMYSCADCGWHHEVPAQAAASPEGEGREAYPGQKFFHDRNKNIRNCDQFKEDVEFIHACHIEGAIDVACRQVFERREKEAFERGDLRELTVRMERLPRVQNDLNTAVLVRLSDVLNALAQESQTGAAPSPSPLRTPQGVTLDCGCAVDGPWVSLCSKHYANWRVSLGPRKTEDMNRICDLLAKANSRPGETGAVTETK